MQLEDPVNPFFLPVFEVCIQIPILKTLYMQIKKNIKYNFQPEMMEKLSAEVDVKYVTHKKWQR